MYNRYIQNDDGNYQQIPCPDDKASPPPKGSEQRESFLDHLLERLHLGDIDKGDILLLLILLFLYDQGEDEELLTALGLLFLL